MLRHADYKAALCQDDASIARECPRLTNRASSLPPPVFASRTRSAMPRARPDNRQLRRSPRRRRFLFNPLQIAVDRSQRYFQSPVRSAPSAFSFPFSLALRAAVICNEPDNRYFAGIALFWPLTNLIILILANRPQNHALIAI